MPTQNIIDGNAAVSEAIRQINPDVFGAYPITPTSHIAEYFSEFVDQGKVQTELVLTESEHASMSVCIGASAGGGRAVTATSSQGLMLMQEALFNASGMRLPIVLINGNRTLSAPLSIHSDHSDIMAVRDTGWIQLHAKDAQEAYDLTIQAFRIAEHPEVRTPVIVAMDGFQVTHTKQKVQIENDEKVKKFIGKIVEINPLLDVTNPVTYGAATKPDYFMENKRSQLEGLIQSEKVIAEIGKEFNKTFKRDYADHGESFMANDAEYIIVCIGSIFGTLKVGIEELRKKGVKIGAVRLRSFRPFPEKYIQKHLSKAKKVAVLERTYSAGGAGGPLFNEIRNVLYDQNCCSEVLPFVAALGGRDFFPHHVEEIYKTLKSDKKINAIESFWLNLRD